MSYKKEIQTLLRKLNVNRTYKGFNYIIYGTQIVIEDPTLLTYICKGLYVEIAMHFNTTITCAERNIRTVKEIIWNRTDKELLYEIFNTFYCPTNAEFIDSLAMYIKNEFNNENY